MPSTPSSRDYLCSLVKKKLASHFESGLVQLQLAATGD